MDFRILGPLEVLDDGRPLTLGGSKQRALLAYFLLHANEALTTERLIDALWGERPPASPAKTLQMHVSRLRRALPDGAKLIVTRERGYELTVEPELLDRHRFDVLLAEGRRAIDGGRPEPGARALEKALSLWRGDTLAEFAYEPFAPSEITRLDDLRATAQEYLIEARLALGRHAEAIPELEALIAQHPYRERLRAQLMLALYRSDRQADALQAYQDARKRLVDELGIEPGERLRELERAVLAQDPALRLAEPAEPVATGQGSGFVGRDRQLGELLAGLDDSFAGRGRLFLLAGEPGIGKSRLAEELTGHARARGAEVLVGRCWEAGGAPAYWPWVQSLRAYVRESDPAELRSQLGDGAADLAQIVPEVRRRFPDLPEPPALEPEAARFRLFDATLDFLRNASATRPILLVLDDLHAADAPSLLLLRFLAREIASAGVLLVGAYRDVDPLPGPALKEMLAAVAGEPATTRLSLGGLSEGEVAEYVGLRAAEIASPEILAALQRDTEGNPLFVGEIVRLLRVEGVPSGAPLELAIPASVRDVIARRLGHLSHECDRVLARASVLGRECALDALARLSGASQDDLLDVLDEAMAARVVTDDPSGPGRVRFAHVLIRDTLYEGLTPARRVRLHRRAVAVLEELYGDDAGPQLAALAHHARAGAELDKCLHYARRAGDRALVLLAYEEAARLYAMALDALELVDPGNDVVRCSLLLSLGEAEARAGETPASKTAYLRAAEIARRRGLRRELARAAAGYGGRFIWNRGWGDAALVPLLEEGLAAVPSEDAELRVRLLARLAGALRDEPTRERCDEVSSAAVQLARHSGSPAALAHALDGRACAVLGPDTLAECLALASELRDVAEGIGDRERMADGHFIRVMVQLQLGDISGAEVDLAAADRIAEELRQPTQLWEVRAARALLALLAGRLDDAEELIEQALELGGLAQPAEAIPVHGLQRYTLWELRGGSAELEPAIGDLAREYPFRPVFRCARAHIHALMGRAEEARRELRDLAADGCSALPRDQEWLYGMSLLAETAALLGETGSAPALYSLLLPWAALNAVDYAEGLRGSASRPLGLLAWAMGREDEAARHFEDAIEMNTRMGARPWLADAQEYYARMLRDRGAPGDREKAQRLHADAVRTYREVGMPVPRAAAAG